MDYLLQICLKNECVWPSPLDLGDRELQANSHHLLWLSLENRSVGIQWRPYEITSRPTDGCRLHLVFISEEEFSNWSDSANTCQSHVNSVLICNSLHTKSQASTSPNRMW